MKIAFELERVHHFAATGQQVFVRWADKRTASYQLIYKPVLFRILVGNLLLTGNPLGLAKWQLILADRLGVNRGFYWLWVEFSVFCFAVSLAGLPYTIIKASRLPQDISNFVLELKGLCGQDYRTCSLNQVGRAGCSCDVFGLIHEIKEEFSASGLIACRQSIETNRTLGISSCSCCFQKGKFISIKLSGVYFKGPVRIQGKKYYFNKYCYLKIPRSIKNLE